GKRERISFPFPPGRSCAASEPRHVSRRNQHTSSSLRRRSGLVCTYNRHPCLRRSRRHERSGVRHGEFVLRWIRCQRFRVARASRAPGDGVSPSRTSSDRFDSTMTADSLITCDPNILDGTPVFKGTRVPVRTFFEYLSDGLSLDYFLETFP